MRPVIKMETIDNGQGGGALQVTIRMMLYSVSEMSKIQEKYTRLAQETETEYARRILLTGGDRVWLLEDKARGTGGQGFS